MATLTTDQFRQDLPEFADKIRFPDTMLTFWLNFALLAVANSRRWGSLLNMGQEMFIAHNVTLERRAMDEAARGLAPGMSPGIVNNKSVDKVSVGYDTQGGAELNAGHWNLTIYGTRYVRMARQVGMGPVQVGTGCGGSPLSGSQAWPGPWPWNFPNQN